MSKSSASGTRAAIRLCLCGCKSPVPTGSTFTPGHDARVKQSFLRVARGEATQADFSMTERAWEYLNDAAWAVEFMPDVKKALRTGRKATRRAS